MNDKQIIELFFNRSEEALTETKAAYGKLYQSIFRSMLENEADREECENDLLFTLWSTIPPQNPESLGAYVAVLSRHAATEKMRNSMRQKRSVRNTILLSELEDCLSGGDEPEKAFDDKEILRAVNDFLESLDKRDRVFFMRRYFFAEDVKEIAKRFHLSENAVSLSLYKSRKKLKTLLIQRGIDL